MSTPAPARSEAEFERFFRDHHAAALRYARRLTRDQHLAEDAVSRAVLRVYHRWQRHPIDNLAGYLSRAVANEVTGGYRSRERQDRIVRALGHEHRAASSSTTQVDDRDEIGRALRHLPPRQRTAVQLRYLRGLTERETSEVMQTTVGTVKSTTSRGLAALRDSLGDAA